MTTSNFDLDAQLFADHPGEQRSLVPATPFAAHAVEYLEAGWWPVPLPVCAKASPPAGWTGTRSPQRPTLGQLERWIRVGGYETRNGPVAIGNIALRMAPDVIGIDVDDGYIKDGAVKVGAATLAELVDRFGPLPGTYSSTARGWGESRIRFYRVPAGTRLRAVPGPSIEIVQHHHRYAVAWPSQHPDAGVYTWFDDAGEELDAPPDVGDLPELPWSWIDGLRAVGDRGASAAAALPKEVQRFFDEHAGMAKPDAVKGLRKLLERDPGRSRHDRLLEVACMAAREAFAGWYPMAMAEDQLRAWWTSVMDNQQRIDGPEFDDAIAWAIAQVDPSNDQPQRKIAEAEQARSRATHADPPAPSSDDRSNITIPKLFDDAHVGEAFATTIAGRYLHCRALGGWLVWDGRRWKRDASEAVYEEARRYVVSIGKQLFAANADKKVIDAAARYRERHKIESIVTIARRLDGIAAEVNEFDQHPDLLVAGNGVVDLRTGELGPHDPALRITQCTPVDYVPGARHADVDAVLQAVDDDVRRWLQPVLGYSATGHTSEDIVIVLDGTGANAKTTVLGATNAALGDYGHAVPARLLMKGAHEEHPALFADLRGRRLAVIEETAEGGALRVETMKAISGGSAITARFMRQDWFEFQPTHMLVVATNHRPAVNSTEHAAWRRLRLVPFPHRYATAELARPGDRIIDTGLRDRLRRGPRQREAMLAWIVTGAVHWYTTGLPACPTVDDATSAWRRDEDVILRYCHDRVDFTRLGEVTVSAVYEDYRRWCDAEGRPAASLKEFRKKLSEHDLYLEHGVTWRKAMHGAMWTGLQLRGAA